MKNKDIYFMRIALKEGQKGLGFTSPNPPVGAVIVKNGEIISKGYHRQAGTPHAEIHALREAGNKAKGATIYVTLEPCNHHGKTPPCTQAILKAGIKRVVIGVRDPNPKAQGGAEFLKNQGLEVITGVLAEECAELCRFFLKSVRKKLPWVLAKAAMSLDGRIATRRGDSKWITGERARSYGHKLRTLCDAILVGKNTVLKDDPLLTCRLRRGKNPVRIILDSKLSLPVERKIFQNKDAQTIVACTEDAPLDKEKKLKENSVTVWRLPEKNGQVDLKALLRKALEHYILSILVEGGAEVHGSFFEQKLVDEVAFFYGPYVIGGATAPCAVGGKGPAKLEEASKLPQLSLKKLGDSFLIKGYLTLPFSLTP
ncbi:bifunctional diaminohydroxyphosphoribosylaminopyrimidine deaminase/5-amino-6-(5-phosphoribosylamino)uracil reductase RibD [Thermodesulfatator autotrophicus]|uniref:Riboflavin biosynthesis protein RibD n=1 Tax=Thermodesulfatator autotrophicus TaxID=1795632 RepID=A0A177E686_9BACT|nr:bifunctional diaminohydroxyphosphoribosylaminopyrimidine deaminase/5-amino-6-(5-phosphoribosylamino)uracil reductase RibD [Thermodesulfatator autotrophicus]OAG26950.1 bifunctional diaminohydroxyphosphoribosylaminopyrimidine deaminase/5-amino-6-(5-phosphoribosylamino)uracil reductase [Thermodesulfatator autotrophicus]